MNPVSTPNADTRSVRDLPLGEAGASATDFALGLQLCRASIMALTRLQLAFERGDRTGAMEAIDRLHALDVETERAMERFPVPAGQGARRQALAMQLREEKMAVAFDKLALASGISGPDLVSPPAFLRQGQAGPSPKVEPLDLADSPPTMTGSFTVGASVALLLTIAAGAVAMVMAALWFAA